MLSLVILNPIQNEKSYRNKNRIAKGKRRGE